MINGLFNVSIHSCETRQDVEGLGRRESILVLVALGKPCLVKQKQGVKRFQLMSMFRQ